jgi:hypothetical protein
VQQLDPARLRPFPLVDHRDRWARLQAFVEQTRATAAALAQFQEGAARVAVVFRSLGRPR